MTTHNGRPVVHWSHDIRAKREYDANGRRKPSVCASCGYGLDSTTRMRLPCGWVDTSGLAARNVEPPAAAITRYKLNDIAFTGIAPEA